MNNDAGEQLFNEVVSSLSPAFSIYTNDPSKGNRITKIQADQMGFAKSLSQAVEDGYQWKSDRGLEIVKVAIQAIEYDEDTKKLLSDVKKAEALVLAAPIYYFTLCAQIQAPIQRLYCVNKPAKVKKMALLVSSYSPGVYDGATAEFRDICNYWNTENMGAVTAKIDEQKTEETKQKVIALAGLL